MVSFKGSGRNSIWAVIIPAVLTCSVSGLIHYADVHNRIVESIYQEAENLRKSYYYKDARELYELIPEYRDSANKEYECTLYSANHYIENGFFVKALGHLHQYKDSEHIISIPGKKLSGKKLFEEAQERLKLVNSQNGLSQIDCYASEWRSEDNAYYLNFVEREDNISMSTNLYSKESKSKKYTYSNDNGIIMSKPIGEDSYTLRFALQYDTDTSILNAYLYKDGSVVSLVKQTVE